MPGGRPTKFEPLLCQRFLALIENGHWFRFACADVGVDKETVRRWLKRGERTGEADKDYREFRARFQEARVKALIKIDNTNTEGCGFATNNPDRKSVV